MNLDSLNALQLLAVVLGVLGVTVVSLVAWAREAVKRQVAQAIDAQGATLTRMVFDAELSRGLRRESNILLVEDAERRIDEALREAGFLRLRHWSLQDSRPIKELQDADLVVFVGFRGDETDDLIRRSGQRWVVVFHPGRFESDEFHRCAPANNELTLIGHCETALRALGNGER